MWLQREIRLPARPRGFHLVTDEVVGALPELRDLEIGLCHLFIRHTSASLTLNENASPDVRRDFATWFDHAVPEDFAWTHTVEPGGEVVAHVGRRVLVERQRRRGVQDVQVGEADAQRAELGQPVDDLPRDEVEAARPRAQAKLPLVPHERGG